VNTRVAVNSLAISKNSDKLDFLKYNLEVSIEEIENRLTSNKLKFGLTLLSNPKNIIISVEGITEISGTEKECLHELEKDEATFVFHAGTKKKNNSIFTNGGRVLGVTSLGNTLESAISNAYSATEKISWPNKYCRTDIGKKGLIYR